MRAYVAQLGDAMKQQQPRVWAGRAEHVTLSNSDLPFYC